MGDGRWATGDGRWATGGRPTEDAPRKTPPRGIHSAGRVRDHGRPPDAGKRRIMHVSNDRDAL